MTLDVTQALLKLKENLPMIHRVFVILPQLMMTVVLASMVSCVDIPSTGPAVPDYRSLTRYLHAGRGIDTVALFVSSSTATKHTLSTVVNGTDTIRITSDSARTYSTYLRIQVNFASAMELLVDGSSVGTLGFGAATPYLDTPSGLRQFKLRGTGQLVDSLAIKDTVVTVHVDTLRPTGKTSTDFTITNANNFFFPLTGSLTTIVDSTQTPVQLATQSQGTLFIMGDIAARNSSRSGLVNFGWVRYIYGSERYTFGSLARTDTAVIRFANVSNNALGAVDIRRTNAGTNDVGALAFSAISRYLAYPAPRDTSYTIQFRRAGTTTVVDSLQIAVSKNRAYTAVLLDSASIIVARTFVDQ
jgi:hypothetical protein